MLITILGKFLQEQLFKSLDIPNIILIEVEKISYI